MNKQQRGTIWGIAIGLAIAGLVAVVALAASTDSPSVATNGPPGSLTLAEETYDFGIVSMANGEVTRQVTITNDSDGPVTIRKGYTSCMCTTAYLTDGSGKRTGPFGMSGHGSGVISSANVVVKPGEQVVVETVFDPAAHGPSGTGVARRSVYLETDSSTTPKLQFDFEANVTP